MSTEETRSSPDRAPPAGLLPPSPPAFDAADFGLAKHGANDLTATDAMMGTPAYMPPEQARGETKTAGPAADVYLLGVMLYEMTTGVRPFTGDSAAAIVYKVIHETAPPSRRREASTPRDVEIITLKCLEKAPRDRYADAGQLADDLGRYLAGDLAGESITARPAGQLERGVKWVRRNPAVSASLLVAVLALVLGTAVSYLKYREARTHEEIARQKAADEQMARLAEQDRVRERDDALLKMNSALDDAKYQLGIGNLLLAVSAFDGKDLRTARERLSKVPPAQQGWEWHYLRRQTEGGIYTLFGHRATVTSAVFSPDGTRIVTGGADGTVRVWDGKPVTPAIGLRGHTNRVNDASFSPDGTRVVTGSEDGTARVWDVKTAKTLLELHGHARAVDGAWFGPDGTRIFTTGTDGSAKMWDATTGKELPAESPPKTRASQAFSPDGRLFAHLDNNRAVLIPLTWDAGETEYRLTHARPNEWRYHEGRVAAGKAEDSFAAAFCLDRLLSMPSERTSRRYRERVEQSGNPFLIARTTFHQPDLAHVPCDRHLIEALAVSGDRLAWRLVAQQRIREDKPALAVPLLHASMITRPPGSPPAEELLIAQAYLALKDRPAAERYHQAATIGWTGPASPSGPRRSSPNRPSTAGPPSAIPSSRLTTRDTNPSIGNHGTNAMSSRPASKWPWPIPTENNPAFFSRKPLS